MNDSFSCSPIKQPTRLAKFFLGFRKITRSRNFPNLAALSSERPLDRPIVQASLNVLTQPLFCTFGVWHKRTVPLDPFWEQITCARRTRRSFSRHQKNAIIETNLHLVQGEARPQWPPLRSPLFQPQAVWQFGRGIPRHFDKSSPSPPGRLVSDGGSSTITAMTVADATWYGAYHLAVNHGCLLCRSGRGGLKFGTY